MVWRSLQSVTLSKEIGGIDLQRQQTKSMVEGALLASLTVLLSVMGIYLPIIGAFISFTWPVPIIILGLRHGLKWSLLATAVSGLILALLVTPMQALALVLGFGLLGIVLGEAIRRDLSVGKIIGIGAVASLFSKVLLFGVGSLILGVNSFTENFTMIQKSMDQVLTMYTQMGMDKNQLATMRESLHNVVELMKIIFPALLVVASILDTFLNYLISQLILKRLGYPAKKVPPFAEWRLPMWVAGGFVIGIIFLIVGQHYKIEGLTTIGLNLQYFSSMLFLIQGFSVASYYLRKFKVVGLVKWLIFIMLFITPFLVGILVWVGLLDIFFNYRRLQKVSKP